MAIALHFSAEPAQATATAGLDNLLQASGSNTARLLPSPCATGKLSTTSGCYDLTAGHNPPMLVSTGGIQRLTSGGPVLGAFAESAYREASLELHSGNTLIVFSDGVTEAANLRQEEFGENRLITILQSCAFCPASEMLQQVLKSVQEFGKGAPQADDITVVVVRYRPEKT